MKGRKLNLRWWVAGIAFGVAVYGAFYCVATVVVERLV